MSGVTKELKPYLTTGQLAKLLAVAPRTVTKWADKGYLECYRIPLTQDRRIPRRAVLPFLREHGYMLPHLPAALGDNEVLCVGVDPATMARLESELPKETARLVASSALFEAGNLAASIQPSAVVIDCLIGSAEAVAAARYLRSLEDQRGVHIVLLANEDGTPNDAEVPGVVVLRRPFEVARLVDLITGRVGQPVVKPRPHSSVRGGGKCHA